MALALAAVLAPMLVLASVPVLAPVLALQSGQRTHRT